MRGRPPGAGAGHPVGGIDDHDAEAGFLEEGAEDDEDEHPTGEQRAAGPALGDRLPLRRGPVVPPQRRAKKPVGPVPRPGGGACGCGSIESRRWYSGKCNRCYQKAVRN